MASSREKRVKRLLYEIKINGLMVQEVEQLISEKYGLSMQSEAYREISKQSHLLLPIILAKKQKLSEPLLTCDEQYFEYLYNEIARQLALSGFAEKIQIGINSHIPGLQSEMIDQDGIVKFIILKNAGHIAMIPEACQALMNAAIKSYLPKIHKQKDYYTYESAGHLVRHITASMIDERLGNNNTGAITTLNTVSELRHSMLKLCQERKLPKDVKKDDLVRCYFNQHARKFGSELAGLVAYDRYQQDPEKVSFFLKQLTEPNFYPAERFLQDIDASYSSQDAAQILEKSLQKIK